MKRYRVINPARFRMVVSAVQAAAWILLTIMLVKFISAHNGLNYESQEVTEYHTYEIVYETSADNDRIKMPVAQKVVYRYVER